MKNPLILFIALCVSIVFIQAQQVGIGTNFPNDKASLEARSINTGVLIPRLTTTQRDNNMTNATPNMGVGDEGMLIYNMTTTNFNYWDGTMWIPFPGIDHDWHESGATPPDNINDNIYTQGLVGIGLTNPVSSLHIDDDNNSIQTIRVEDLSQTGDAYNPNFTQVGQSNRASVIVDKTTGDMYAIDADQAFWRLDGNANITTAGYSGSCPNLVSTSMNASNYDFIGTRDNSDFIFATNDTERMRILRDGQMVFYGKGITTPASSPTGCVPAYPVIDVSSFYATGDIYPLNAYSENAPAIYGAAEDNGGFNQTCGVAGTSWGSGYGCWGYIDGTATGLSVGVFCEETTLAGWACFIDGDVGLTGTDFGFSDESLKRNIQPYSGGLDIVMQLEPKSFDFKPEYHDYGFPRNNKIGFIAQDVEQILPTFIKKSTIPAPHAEKGKPETRLSNIENVLAMDYSGLIPILTNSIQEQQVIIDELKQENQEVKDLITQLEQRLALLED